MKVLVIPDIHLKKWIFDKAEGILKEGKADRAVCLMDIPDDIWFFGGRSNEKLGGIHIQLKQVYKC